MGERDLSELLSSLPTARNPRASTEILAIAQERARRRRWTAGAGVATLSAAAAAALVVPREPGVRARGVGGPMPVAIEALAEGDAGLRPLRDGDVVHPGERVVFRLDAGGPGELSLREGDAAIWPTDGPWRVTAGRWFLGDPPLAWSADAGPHTVEAQLCDERGACTSASFHLVFDR